MQLNDIKTIEDLESYRKSLNESCDKRECELRRCAMLGELCNKPFGYLKECMESMSPRLFATKHGKSILNKYTDTIRENRNLSSLHTLYESIRKADNTTDTDFFLNAMTSNINGVNTKTLKGDVKKLGKVVAEAFDYLKENELPQDNCAELDKAVNYITEHKMSMSNLADYSRAVKVLREHIESKGAVTETKKSTNLRSTMEGFNSKYANSLSESDIRTLSMLGSISDRKKLFEDKKSECLNVLNEAMSDFDKQGDTASVSRIGSIITGIQNKNYNEGSLVVDINNLSEISDLFAKKQ